ncbi:MAG: fibronectin type III domain-containing protein [Limisphaerales bacterium]
MKNPIINSVTKLVPQLKAAIPGVTKYTAEIGLGADLATTMTTIKDDLITKDKEYEQGKIERKKRHKNLKGAIHNGRNHVMIVRQALKPSLSPRYTQLWDALGFNGSLKVPEKAGELMLSLTKMANHFTANPDLATADANLAAAKATALEAAILAAQTALNEQKGELSRLFEARKKKATEAHLLMRELFSTLTFKLTPVDSRWVEFGFNKPGAKPKPDVPQGVTAILIGPTAVSVKWLASPRANHYRVWRRIVGTDIELVPVVSAADLDHTLENLPNNADVEIAVSAVNHGGESAMSQVVLVTTT